MKGLVIEMYGTEGLFNVEKRVTLFKEHSTEVTIKEATQAIKKEITKLVKNGSVSITISELQDDYTQKSLHRFIMTEWLYDGTNELDSRKYNGYDFGDSKKLQFASFKDSLKFVMVNLSQYVATTMGSLPETESLYAQSLNN